MADVHNGTLRLSEELKDVVSREMERAGVHPVKGNKVNLGRQASYVSFYRESLKKMTQPSKEATREERGSGEGRDGKREGEGGTVRGRGREYDQSLFYAWMRTI